MTDTFFTVIDTANLWMIAGGLSEAEARPLFDWPEGDIDLATVDVGLNVTTASGAGKTLVDPVGQATMRACARYLGKTQTFSQAISTFGSVVGHWLVFIYRHKNDDLSLRPVYIRKGGTPAAIDSAELMMTLLKVLEDDLHGPRTTLRDKFKTSGGLVLAPALASRMSAH